MVCVLSIEIFFCLQKFIKPIARMGKAHKCFTVWLLNFVGAFWLSDACGLCGTAGFGLVRASEPDGLEAIPRLPKMVASSFRIVYTV